jgi:uncharacterized protein with von Willebrand factor type A (vWA) domain
VNAQLSTTQTLAEYRAARAERMRPQRERALNDARRTMRKCREEMRSWAKWWRRGSLGSTPEIVLRGAVAMRKTAEGMARQVRDIEAELKGGLA